MFQEVPAETNPSPISATAESVTPSPALLINDPEGDKQDKQGRDTNRNQIEMVLSSEEVCVNNVRCRAARQDDQRQNGVRYELGAP